MDLQQLKSFATRQTPTDVLYVFLQHLEVIPALIKLATSKRIDKKTKMGGDSATATAPAAYVKMPPSPGLEPPPQSGTRAAEDVSEVEKNARGELDDYRCVLTKQGFPQSATSSLGVSIIRNRKERTSINGFLWPHSFFSPKIWVRLSRTSGKSSRPAWAPAVESGTCSRLLKR